MANKIIGYVLVKGSQGAEVPLSATIYASLTCKTVIRPGKGAGGGTDYYNYDAENQKKLEQNKKDKKTARGLTFGKLRKDVSKMVKDDAPKSPEPAVGNEPEPGNANKDGTITQHEKYHEVSQTLEDQEKRAEELEKSGAALKAVSFPTTAASSMEQWFNDVEAYIDAIPDMAGNAQMVYVVENKDGIWTYTGDYGNIDPEWNKKINASKNVICAKLNALSQQVTDKVTAFLQDLADRMTACKPFIMAIQIIQQIPTLTTIIKWATSVIDFLMAAYNLIKSYFELVMKTLELVIVRFPQLVNKIMGKIAKVNCSVQPQIKAVKIHMNDGSK